MRSSQHITPGMSVAEAAYASAHFGKSLLWHGSQLLFAYFLTEACGFSPLAMGLTLTVALLANALCDLGVGRLLTRLSLSYPAIARVQLAGAVLTVLAILVFAWSGRSADREKMVMVVAGLGAFALAYSLVDVPQNAALGLAPFGADRRKRASATRLVLSGSAEVVVVTGFAVLMRGLPAPAVGEGFLWLSLGTGCVAIAGAALLAATARAGSAAGATASKGPAVLPRTAGAAAEIGAVLTLVATFTISAKVTGKMEPYIAAHWFATARDGAVFMSAIAIGSMLGQPLWLRRLRTHEAGRDLLEPALAMALGGLIFPLSALGLPVALASGLLLGMGQGGISLSLWTRLADLCSRTPQRAAELTGLFTFAAKSVGALSTLVMSQLLFETGTPGGSPQIWAGVHVITWLPTFAAACLLLEDRRFAARLTDEPAMSPEKAMASKHTTG
jgi:GPH family glycoside/pentoside/hexuronide:cation symporter